MVASVSIVAVVNACLVPSHAALIFQTFSRYSVEPLHSCQVRNSYVRGDFRVPLKQLPNLGCTFTLLVLGIELDLRNLHNRP